MGDMHGGSLKGFFLICQPFGSISVTYIPLVLALDGSSWLTRSRPYLHISFLRMISSLRKENRRHVAFILMGFASKGRQM